MEPKPLTAVTPPPTPAPPEAPRLVGTTFLAFGDSITAGEINDDHAVPLSTGVRRFFPFRVVPELSYRTQLGIRLRAAHPDQAAQINAINAGVKGIFLATMTPCVPGNFRDGD